VVCAWALTSRSFHQPPPLVLPPPPPDDTFFALVEVKYSSRHMNKDKP
jgi:hypothetical protein